VLVIVGGLGWFVIWGIKLYIRRMLQLAGVTPELQRDQRHKSGRSGVSITAPIEEGILDLRSGLRSGNGSYMQRLLAVAKSYKVFLLILGALVVFVALFIWYLILALSSDRGYEASYEQNGQMIPVEQLDEETDGEPVLPIVVDTLPEVALVNRSGVASADDGLAERLRQQGYDVVFNEVAQTVIEDRTVIVYDPSLADQIVRLQAELDGALLSSFKVDNPDEPMVTIYVGADQAQ
jgi:hypothetical protein